MFGYILPDKPNMFMKDYALYKCFYCGMCKSIREKHKSELLRTSVNYDMTFINILFHGIADQPMEFKREGCILNPFKKKTVLKSNAIMEKCVYLNTLLAEFKMRDDLRDEPSLGKKFIRRVFKRHIRKARNELPVVAALLDVAYEKQAAVENAKSNSFDEAATPFAECMQGIFENVLGEKYTEDVGDLAFYLAKYVYLLDAVDDFGSDVKKGEYNPFALYYKDCATKAELMDKHEKEIRDILTALIYNIKDSYSRIQVFNTESIITNTLWFGLNARAKAVFDKENEKCIKIHTKF